MKKQKSKMEILFEKKQEQMTKNHKGPRLSIGLIVKNEEKHIDKCLSALETLRKELDCELIIGDTGSTDATKEIALKYTDNVFDIIWEDDFGSARNQVMDKAKGEWFLTLDADEYLDENITEIIDFFKTNKHIKYNSAFIKRIDYTGISNTEFNTGFINIVRFVRLSTGIRYNAKIHESLPEITPSKFLLNSTLHHYGYIYESEEEKIKKFKRNDDLLVKELEETPNNLRTLSHIMDSVMDKEKQREYSERIVSIVKKNKNDQYSEPCFRKAILFFYSNENKELALNLAKDALNYFPNSFYNQLEMNYLILVDKINNKKYDEILEYSKKYISLHKQFKDNKFNLRETLSSSVPISGSELTFNSTIILSILSILSEDNKEKINISDNLLNDLKEIFNSIYNKNIKINLIYNYILLCAKLCEYDIDIKNNLNDFFRSIFNKESTDTVKYNDEKSLEKINENKRKFTEKILEKIYFENNSNKNFLKQISETNINNNYINWIRISTTEDKDKINNALRKTAEENIDMENYPKIPYELAIKYNLILPKFYMNQPIELLENIIGIYSYNNKNSLEDINNYISNNNLTNNIFNINWSLNLIRIGLSMQNKNILSEDNEIKQIKDNNKNNNNNIENTISSEEIIDKKDEEKIKIKYDSSLIIKLSNEYNKIQKLYFQKIYNKDIIDDEFISILSKEHRFGFYFIKAMDMFNNKNYVEFIKRLKIALKHDDYMKNFVEFYQDYITENYLNKYDEEQEKNEEFLLLAKKVKEQANNFINSGMKEEAKQVLNQLLKLCPNDTEITEILNKIK